METKRLDYDMNSEMETTIFRFLIPRFSFPLFIQRAATSTDIAPSTGAGAFRLIGIDIGCTSTNDKFLAIQEGET